MDGAVAENGENKRLQRRGRLGSAMMLKTVQCSAERARDAVPERFSRNLWATCGVNPRIGAAQGTRTSGRSICARRASTLSNGFFEPASLWNGIMAISSYSVVPARRSEG